MIVAIIGSINLTVRDLWKYLPPETSEIVLGEENGDGACARNFAWENGIKLTEFPPEHKKYGRLARLMRNTQMIAYSDYVLVFCDGKGRDTKQIVDGCKEKGIPVEIWVQSAERP